MYPENQEAVWDQPAANDKFVVTIEITVPADCADDAQMSVSEALEERLPNGSHFNIIECEPAEIY